MLFVEPAFVNEVWERVAQATARNELGIAAKVAPREERGSARERLVCIYTYDFRDRDDIARVLHRLRQLELVRDRATGKYIYYKAGRCLVFSPFSLVFFPLLSGTFVRRDRACSLIKYTDAFTYLGIGSGNPWGLRASLYSSKDIFGYLKEKEGKSPAKKQAVSRSDAVEDEGWEF